LNRSIRPPRDHRKDDLTERRFGRDYFVGLKDVPNDKYDAVVAAATCAIQHPAIKDLELPMLLPGIKVNTFADRPRAGRPDAVHAVWRQDLAASRRARNEN
jgi:hypothetical protein